ncbi:MAG: hypothetical protein Fur002_05100 [Anaerolineales bacterium]
MRKSNRKLLEIFLILWAALCVSLFMLYPGRLSYIHGAVINLSAPSVTIDAAGYILSLVKAFLGASLFSISAAALGARILTLIFSPRGIEEHSQFALFATAFLLGHIIYSSIYIFFGAFERLTAGLSIALMAFSLLVGIKPLWQMFPKKIPTDLMTLNTYYKVLLGLCFFIIFAALLYSSSRVSYDAVAFYLSDQKLTALTQRIQFFQNNSFTVSEFQSAIPYAAIMQIFGDQAARMYAWVNGILILFFGLALAEKAGLSRRAQIIWISTLLSSTAFIDLTGDGKIDLVSVNTAMAAVYWATSAQRNWRVNFFLTGVMAGFAMSLRPFNVFLVAVFVAFTLLIRLYREKKFAPFLQTTLQVSAGVLAMLALHLYFNYFLLGDPFAMFTDMRVISSANWQWTFDPQYIWLARALYPLTVTFLNIPQSNGNISPIFVAMLPLLFIKNVRAKTKISVALRDLTLASAATVLLWISLSFTVVEIRYVLFLWALIFMSAALLIETAFEAGGFFPTPILKAAFAATLIFTAFRAVYFSIYTYSPVEQGNQPRCGNIAPCEALRLLHQDAPFGARVLTMNPYRYYLRSDLLACSSSREEIKSLRDLSKIGMNAFWEEAYRQGYTYITYEENYGIRHLYIESIPVPETAPNWLKLETLYASPDESIFLYRLSAENPPTSVKTACKKNNAGIWTLVSLASMK